MPRLISASDGSAIMLGIQSAYGTPIRTHNAPVLNSEGSAITTPGFIQKAFPVRRLDVDGDAEINESDLLTGSGAVAPDEIGQIWSQGVFDVRLLVEDFIHMLYGILNPSALPTNADLADKVIQAGGTTLTAGKATFTETTSVAMQIGSRGYSKIDTVAGLLPSQLELTIPGTAGTKKALVRGFRQIGRPTDDRYYQEETVDFAANATTGTTTKFWSKIIDVDFSVGATNPASLGLTFKPVSKKTIMRFNTTNAIFGGWTGLLSRGRVPARVQDLVPRTMTISADATGMSAAFECQGVKFQDLRTPEGGDNEVLAIPASDYTDHFADAPTRNYPGWGGAFQFGEDIVKYESLEFVVDQRLDFSRGVDGSRYRSGLARQGQRRVTIRPVTEALAPENAADTTQRWERNFIDELRLPLKLVAYAFGSDGRGYRLGISSASSQLNEYPRFPIEGQGPVNRGLSFLAQPTATETSEIVVEIISENGFSLAA